MRTPVVVLAALLAALTPAAAEDLPTFLKAATAAARPNVPLRADGALVTTSPDGTARDQIAIVRRPNGDLYVELHGSGARALLLGDGSKALLVPASGKSAETFALDAPLGTSEFSGEDLRPFSADAYRSPSIVDRNGDELTVSLTPQRASQYALQVITFDGPKKVPVVVKNYKDTVSNLVKMRRTRGFTSLGGTFVPAEVTMENFPMRSTSTVTLQWKAVEDQPALFDPASLGKPSAITWPDAAK